MSYLYQNQCGSVRYNWSVKVTLGGITKRFSLGTKDEGQAKTMKTLIDNMEVQSRINPQITDELWRQFYQLIGQANKYLDIHQKENPLVIDAFEECIDIDTQRDWSLAEEALKKHQLSIVTPNQKK